MSSKRFEVVEPPYYYYLELEPSEIYYSDEGDLCSDNSPVSVNSISKKIQRMSCYFSTELERAVVKGDLENVRALLNRGADVNLEVGQDKCTLLDITSSVEVTKELLLRGVRVDRTNIYRETPLYSYISLLECGSDINVRYRLYDNYSTPLDNAAGDVACAKLLIKITLIKNFNRDYRKIVGLSPYKEFRAYSELSRYLDDCVCEIVQMKTDKVNDNLSLYEFVIKSASIKTLHACNKITDQVILTNYPIYHDMISDKVKLCLERASLLNKLSELQIYMGSDISNQDVKEKKVILNFDCTYNIAKYLSNDDLLNLITAYKHADQSLDFSKNLVESSQRPSMKLDEVSETSCAKRARLESPHIE